MNLDFDSLVVCRHTSDLAYPLLYSTLIELVKNIKGVRRRQLSINMKNVLSETVILLYLFQRHKWNNQNEVFWKTTFSFLFQSY